MKNPFSFLEAWKFDPISSIFTMVVLPIGIYVIVKIRRFIKESAGYLVDGIIYSLNKAFVHKVAAAFTLRRYCRLQLAGSTKLLRIPASTEVSIDIDEIFIPLVLENFGVGASYNSSSILSAGSRIRIIGDPGSGKSSAAKRLFRDECQRAIIAPSRARFPVFIELRTLDIPKNVAAKKLGDWMLTYVRENCAKHDVYNLLKCLDVYTYKTGLLVIFDGLDEVSSANYQRIAVALNLFSETLQQLGDNNVIVITLRTQFHQQVRPDFQDAYPTVLSVKRFSPSDIYEFLTRWPFATGRFENVVRIYNELTDRPSLREMCTNPLVLSMYVAQDQIGGGLLAPDSRSEFYSKVVEELLIKRRAKQIGALSAQAVVRQQRQQILGRIAFNHLLDKDQSPNHLKWSEAVDVVINIARCKDREDATRYLRELSKETGLIGEEQEGESFRFIHLTFCEFFCAYEAVHGQKDGWNVLMNSYRLFQADASLRARLVECLPFAVALMPRHMRSDALQQVGACNNLHLLAMTFLEAKLYDHELWPKFVDESIARLSAGAGRDKWDADWLRELHLFLVVASDAERSAEVMGGVARSDVVDAFFEEFARVEVQSLVRLIQSYAEQDASAAFRVANLCGIDLLNEAPEIVVSGCSQPPFLALALERALREQERLAIWMSLFAEGGLRSRAAADLLGRRSERPWQGVVVAKVPRSRRWYSPLFGRDSFYFDCISLAYDARLQHPNTPLLNILSTLAAPGAFSRIGVLCGRRLELWIGAMYFSGGVLASSFMQRRAIDNAVTNLASWTNLIAAGVAILAALSFLFGLSYTYRRGLYCAALNVTPPLTPAALFSSGVRRLLMLKWRGGVLDGADNPRSWSYPREGNCLVPRKSRKLIRLIMLQRMKLQR
ncbi:MULTISPECIES: NACHT domain-containing protein [unclassified Bradyrhizobium]|uniref:NACHT domain-containing protein n=1 Tax=unclassified Bradyrhizobium TaxID=2631580 RepID=UPI0029162BBC|nr:MULTISPECIES: NACHT domain-containing protein [unclassified Bradyrhizobium]